MELAAEARDPGAARAGLEADALSAARGDRAAFERLYRATCARVATLARRLLGRERVDEAIQEVYLRAWRGLPSWRGEASARTWLEQVARNTLIHMAARRPSLGSGAGDALEQHPAPGPGSVLRLDLEEAIAGLPEGARLVFVLHDLERLAHEEIATRLGIAVGTSKSQLHRARLLLRAALGPEGDQP